MGKFRVVGAYADTGEDAELVVDAATELAAAEVAQKRGVLVSRVFAAQPPQEVVVQRSAMPAVPMGVQPGRQYVHSGHDAAVPTINVNLPRRGNSAALTSLILGAIALVLCWIPLVNLLGGLVAGVGLLMALIGFAIALTRGGAGMGFTIGGGVLNALALGVTVMMYVILGGAAQAASEAMEREAARIRQEAATRNAAPATPPAASTPAGVVRPEAPKAPATVDETQLTVYVTGSRYHRLTCTSLGSSPTRMSLAEAKKKGLKECTKCDPIR
jgi:hypothetical protein